MPTPLPREPRQAAEHCGASCDHAPVTAVPEYNLPWNTVSVILHTRYERGRIYVLVGCSMGRCSSIDVAST